MQSPQNIFLVGPMGAGKSTVGRQLATNLSLTFVDSDHEIVARTGADIPWIFDVEGEEGFRDRETAIIDDLTQQQGIVLATGGGAILRAENRAALKKRGTVIYLHTSVDEQLRRTARDKNRPLLQTANPREVLQNLMSKREPLYREIADVVIVTESGNIRHVLHDIMAALAVDS